MIYSLEYDDSGKIHTWAKGNSLGAVHNSNPREHFGIVSKYPKELETKKGHWIMQNCRVSRVNTNGTVEVELGK